MTKRSFYQKDIAIINIYVPKKRVPKYKKQQLTEMVRRNKFNKNTWRIQYPTFKNG